MIPGFFYGHPFYYKEENHLITTKKKAKSFIKLIGLEISGSCC